MESVGKKPRRTPLVYPGVHTPDTGVRVRILARQPTLLMTGAR